MQISMFTGVSALSIFSRKKSELCCQLPGLNVPCVVPVHSGEAAVCQIEGQMAGTPCVSGSNPLK